MKVLGILLLVHLCAAQLSIKLGEKLPFRRPKFFLTRRELRLQNRRIFSLIKGTITYNIFNDEEAALSHSGVDLQERLNEWEDKFDKIIDSATRRRSRGRHLLGLDEAVPTKEVQKVKKQGEKNPPESRATRPEERNLRERKGARQLKAERRQLEQFGEALGELSWSVLGEFGEGVRPTPKKRNRKLMFGGGGANVVVAPHQGSGIANAQIVVNSLGTPASSSYNGANTIPGYDSSEADPKVVVTRFNLPGSSL